MVPALKSSTLLVIAVLSCLIGASPVEGLEPERPQADRLDPADHVRDFSAALFDLCIPLARGTPLADTVGYRSFGRPELDNDSFETRSDVGIVLFSNVCHLGSAHHWDEDAKTVAAIEDRLEHEGWIKLNVPQPFAGPVYVSEDYRLRVDFTRDLQFDVQAFTSSPDAVRDHFAVMATAQARPPGQAVLAGAAECSAILEDTQRYYVNYGHGVDEDIPEINRVMVRADNGLPTVLGQLEARVDVTPEGCQIQIFEGAPAVLQALKTDIETTLSDPGSGWALSSDGVWRNADGATLAEKPYEGDGAPLQYLVIPSDIDRFHAFFQELIRAQTECPGGIYNPVVVPMC